MHMIELLSIRSRSSGDCTAQISPVYGEARALCGGDELYRITGRTSGRAS